MSGYLKMVDGFWWGRRRVREGRSWGGGVGVVWLAVEEELGRT